MDCLAQIMSEKYSNPIEFLNQLRQTTEPIGGGMEYSDNGEYVEYDVAVEAVKRYENRKVYSALISQGGFFVIFALLING